jgi:post-segregation antitoxin (ccd killing protein)
MELIHRDADRDDGAGRTRTLAVQIDLDLVRDLIQHCRCVGLDMSSAVTAAVEAYLDHARPSSARTA